MCEFAEVRRSSPITAGNTTPDVPSPLTPTTLARAPSTASSLRQRLFSPQAFDQLTRRLSLSPLSARHRRAGLRSSNSTSKLGEFSQKMSTPTTPETVRKRRGFRPLSIVTSALFPFEFDPARTMEKAQNSQLDSPDPVKTSPDIALEPSESQMLPSVASDTDSDPTPSPSKAASIRSGNRRDDAPGAQRDDLSITSTVALKRTPAPSIKAQIKQARIEKARRTPAPSIKTQIENARKTPAPSIKSQIEKIDVAEYLRRQEAATAPIPEDHEPVIETRLKDVQIADEYPEFYKLPPPDPNNHPAFRLDPFNCTDDARPLTTNWTKYQIKQWTADKYLRDRNMLPEQNPESKSPLKKILPSEKKSPEKEETSIFEALSAGSPVPASGKGKTPQTPRRDTFGSITPSELRVGSSTFTPITDEFDKKSKSARSLSSLFKRSGTDNSKSSNSSTLTISSPIDQSIIHPTATTELRRHDLVRSDPTLSQLRLLTSIRSATFASFATVRTSNSTGQACTLDTPTQAMNGSPATSNAPTACPIVALSAVVPAVPTKLPPSASRITRTTHMEEKKHIRESWISQLSSHMAKKRPHFLSVRLARRLYVLTVVACVLLMAVGTWNVASARDRIHGGSVTGISGARDALVSVH